MKKIISFEKKIDFPSMIGEITAISLEHDLKFINESNIEGMLTVSGSYKLTEASRIEENFSYELPTEIMLSEKLDINSAKIDIEDFYYEIENEYNLICYIDIKVEGVEEVTIEEEPVELVCSDITEPLPELKEETLKVDKIEYQNEEETIRECDGDYHVDYEEESKLKETMIKDQQVSSLFENINDSEETYTTYSVYILREEETITSLMSKYNTTKEDLENYNDLSSLTIGSKIIIPSHNE